MLFYGWRPYGRLKAGDGLAVATRFFHLFWIPLVPYRGLIVVNDQRVKSRLRLRSVLRGYAQAWGPVLLLFGAGLFAENGGAVAAVWIVGLVLAAVGWAPPLSNLDADAATQVREELQELMAAHEPPNPLTQPTPPAR